MNILGIPNRLHLIEFSEKDKESGGQTVAIATNEEGYEISIDFAQTIEGVRKIDLQDCFKNGKSKIIDGKFERIPRPQACVRRWHNDR